MPRPLVAALLITVPLSACAGVQADVVVDGPLEAAAEPLPPPRTPAEAQMFLSASIAALRAGEGAHAALFLDAILKSDHLTDRGRANLYWLLVDAHRARLARLGATQADQALVDALGGFLVAADVLEQDADLAVRQVEARAVLTATRLRSNPDLGQSPDAAIIVEDARDPAGVVAELRCGPRDEHYYERQVSSVGGLESRELVCAGDGTLRTLWFDVSLAR
ncbi:MAG: hypothetical protein A2138_15840 [Deltaproteobacteria bacterium RBG_16_71_12]|nr:MAG: hypothetical protein A2138_15840 [Deltaproteobacteria bacterium RBG_16_71_12]